MKLNLNKLNSLGISHIIVPLVVIVAVASVGTYVLVKSHAAVACTGQVFRVGSQGQCVKDIQVLLNSYQTSTVISVRPQLVTDGSFGNLTKARVVAWQKIVYLGGGGGGKALTPDGVVGPATWKKICSNFKYDPGHYVGEATDTAYYNYAGCPLATGARVRV
jgi:peptidoglycan hydrolase-like protein with peptidoglycan-binding domain